MDFNMMITTSFTKISLLLLLIISDVFGAQSPEEPSLPSWMNDEVQDIVRRASLDPHSVEILALEKGGDLASAS